MERKIRIIKENYRVKHFQEINWDNEALQKEVDRVAKERYRLGIIPSNKEITYQIGITGNYGFKVKTSLGQTRPSTAKTQTDKRKGRRFLKGITTIDIVTYDKFSNDLAKAERFYSIKEFNDWLDI